MSTIEEKRERKFRVVLGMSVCDENTPGFCDSGVTYHNVPQDRMVVLQAMFKKHSPKIMVEGGAMDKLIDELLDLGFDEAQVVMERPAPGKERVRPNQGQPQRREG